VGLADWPSIEKGTINGKTESSVVVGVFLTRSILFGERLICEAFHVVEARDELDCEYLSRAPPIADRFPGARGPRYPSRCKSDCRRVVGAVV